MVSLPVHPLLPRFFPRSISILLLFQDPLLHGSLSFPSRWNFRFLCPILAAEASSSLPLKCPNPVPDSSQCGSKVLPSRVSSQKAFSQPSPRPAATETWLLGFLGYLSLSQRLDPSADSSHWPKRFLGTGELSKLHWNWDEWICWSHTGCYSSKKVLDLEFPLVILRSFLKMYPSLEIWM